MEPPQSQEQPSYGVLFSRLHRRSTLLASTPWFLQDIATYGVGIFTPAIIGMLAFADETDFMVREMRSAKGSAIVDLFLILGFICAILLVEKLGRIRLQIIGFLGMAVGLGMLAASGLLPSGSRGRNWAGAGRFFSLQFHDECRTQFHHIFAVGGGVSDFHQSHRGRIRRRLCQGRGSVGNLCVADYANLLGGAAHANWAVGVLCGSRWG